MKPEDSGSSFLERLGSFALAMNGQGQERTPTEIEKHFAKLLTVIIKAGESLIENQNEVISFLTACQKLSEMPEAEARAIIEKAFHEINEGEEVPAEQIDEIVKQLNFRQPETMLVPLTKTGSKIYDGKTDFTGGKAVNVGRRKKPALVKVETFVSTVTEDGLTLPKSLSRYDKQVQHGIFSLIESGQTVFSSKQVYEAFAGKSTTSPQAIGKVTRSINKMRTTLISIDWTEHARLNGLPVDPGKGDYVVTEENLLHLRRVRIRSNGQDIDGYQVITAPILYRYAKEIGQICTIDRKLFDVPINNTDPAMILRNEILQRIEQIKNPKNKMTNNIKYSTIYEIAEAGENRIQRQRTRAAVKKMLEAWKEKGYIKDFKDNMQGREYASITIIV